MINVIITCDHTECEYCHEKECEKPVIWIDDSECKAMERSENERI